MGLFKNFLEPGKIIGIFTIGTWINRRNQPNTGDESRPSLLTDNTEEQRPAQDRQSQVLHHGSRQRIHSRVVAQFPFLLEIWHWLLTYLIYQGLRAISVRTIAGPDAVFQKAEHHALQILSLEHQIHLDIELFVQHFVLDRVPWLMGIFARVYHSHIMLGVALIVYCYTFFPRPHYQSIRRTLALENAIAFTVLSLWRCKPPRLLPEEFGFIDVLHNRSSSAWTQNKFRLTIAAMPSLHFGNSVLIAFCLGKYSPHWVLRVLSPLWPMVMGLTIVATANHFILNAGAGVGVMAAFWFNRVMLVLLALERRLFQLIRLEKPRES
ncbi:hypothetical protein NUU61_002434 [Penicillium alfredii]|uniref:Inositolphosphotransferase Aur1/Ipt1 domain-containing protein n=1 Tax=Penicillium alfredii TaxID=1506179 RepID=A0A9W9FRM5_9EURO|nr:uncharacterized protein NUU61_002434 [Penicillium alfredii]KAJ5105087.1 hypothetical protein NUU61_002434 [Penicillium alfredii]